MIRYSLLCEGEHGFDSWFRDSDAFDALSGAGQVCCPACGSTAVRKALMAPSVVTARGKAAIPDAALPVEAGPSPAVAGPADDRARQLRAMARALRRHVTANADDVGRAFAAEARAIHEGTAPERAIYGEASREEVSDLLDDGVPLLPLPPLPDDQH